MVALIDAQYRSFRTGIVFLGLDNPCICDIPFNFDNNITELSKSSCTNKIANHSAYSASGKTRLTSRTGSKLSNTW